MSLIARFTERFAPYRYTRAGLLQYGLIAAWALAMIALPILKWTFGREIIPTAVTLALLIQFMAVIVILVIAWGISHTARAFVITGIFTWAAEAIGAKTGFPFGLYTYTDALQPQIAGVPLLIPLAWFMMLPCTWAIAQVMAAPWQGRVYYPAVYAAVTGAAITAWDFFLDPQMVEWGFWQWSPNNPDTFGSYFGIPWANFAGWFLTAVLATALARPDRTTIPVAPLLLMYGITWFLESIGLALFWGQPGPAVIGSISMGLLLAASVSRLAWRSTIP